MAKKDKAEVKVHIIPNLGKQDMVNHPNHYAPNGVDSFMHMKDQMGKAAFDGFPQGNAIKYVQRYASRASRPRTSARPRSTCSTSRSRLRTEARRRSARSWTKWR